MPQNPPPIPLMVASFAAVAVAIGSGNSIRCRLLTILRERHAAAWDAAGRPEVAALLGRASGAQIPATERARVRRLVGGWAYRTPDWARTDAQARTLLWTLRGLRVLGLAGIACWFALAFQYI